MTFGKTVELPLILNLDEGQFSFPEELPIIYALDTGGTSGWAVFDSTMSYVLCGQITGQHHSILNEHLQLHLGRTVTLLDHTPKNSLWAKDLGVNIKVRSPREIVCESFQFRQFEGFDKSKVELDSMEYIGVVKLYSQLTGVPVTFQTASMAKNFISDDKLRRLGWYDLTKGMVHARDALRHLLYFLIVTKKIREPFTNQWLKKAGK